MTLDEQIRQARIAWAPTVGIAAAVVDDPRMPGPDDTPITFREWAALWCRAQGVTDPAEIRRRWTTMQRWPQRRPAFPPPLIPDPPRARRGNPPAIFSQRQLDEWAVEYAPRTHRTDAALIERLESLTEPLTLAEAARVLNLYPSTLTRARDASLRRIAQGEAREVEVPAPTSGTHGDYGATYDPRAWAHFWVHRPGQGIHPGRDFTGSDVTI